jgi:hypothetical protein
METGNCQRLWGQALGSQPGGLEPITSGLSVVIADGDHDGTRY